MGTTLLKCTYLQYGDASTALHRITSLSLHVLSTSVHSAFLVRLLYIL